MPDSSVRVVLALTLVVAFTPARSQEECVDGETRQCVMGICACVDSELLDTSKQAAGLLLEQWLINSRNESIVGAAPVPADIRAKLARFVDKAVLDAARYKIDESSELNLANLNLHYGDMVANHVAAVTMIDVIVFRDTAAAADASIWAHELHHVRQFREWGVHDFAMRYAHDFHEVEDPAYAFAELYRNRTSTKIQPPRQ